MIVTVCEKDFITLHDFKKEIQSSGNNRSLIFGKEQQLQVL
jgi:hypothetical protein